MTTYQRWAVALALAVVLAGLVGLHEVTHRRWLMSTYAAGVSAGRATQFAEAVWVGPDSLLCRQWATTMWREAVEADLP